MCPMAVDSPPAAFVPNRYVAIDVYPETLGILGNHGERVLDALNWSCVQLPAGGVCHRRAGQFCQVRIGCANTQNCHVFRQKFG